MIETEVLRVDGATVLALTPEMLDALGAKPGNTVLVVATEDGASGSPPTTPRRRPR